MAPARDIADEPDWEEITTVPQFRERVDGRFGVIVIADDTRSKPIVHDRKCSFVDEDFFVEKVIVGDGDSGKYYWAKNSRIARERLNARNCKHAGDRLHDS